MLVAIRKEARTSTRVRRENTAVAHLTEAETGTRVPVYEQELWTSKQRQGNAIHEVSYRACFKPQLPAYFINRLTEESDVVYDPFSGRGTTAVEAALLGRRVIANDINPLSAILIRPRLEVPLVADVDKRLRMLKFAANISADIDLSMFYHPHTLFELLGLAQVKISLQLSLQALRHEHCARMSPLGLFSTQANLCLDSLIRIHHIANGQTGYFSHTHACMETK